LNGNTKQRKEAKEYYKYRPYRDFNRIVCWVFYNLHIVAITAYVSWKNV